MDLNLEPDLQKLCDSIHQFERRGWTPATSSNFSMRNPHQPSEIFISQSGLDKQNISPNDFMIIDLQGKSVNPNLKSSAETALHTMIYENSNSQCVLHVHSLASTSLSLIYASKSGVIFENLEILKAFEGIKTHQTSFTLPIFPNSQNIEELAHKIKSKINFGKDFGFLLEGHGLYTWGKSISEAKKHLEAFEFCSEIKLRLR